MSVHDDINAVQRCLDDLHRSLGRLEHQLGSGGLEIRRVRLDADHLRESVALLREAAAALGRAAPARPRHHLRRAVRHQPVDGLGRRGLGARDRRAPEKPQPTGSDLATGTEPQQNSGGVRSRTRAAIAAPHLRTDRWWLAPACTAARSAGLRRLLDLAGLRERRLLRGAVRLALLLTVPGGELPEHAREARTPISSAAGEASPRDHHPDLPARLPADLLLLPQGLLPRLLGVPARLRGGRAAPHVHRRDPLPAGPAERPPVLLLRRPCWWPAC